jgi:hypothetical protein
MSKKIILHVPKFPINKKTSDNIQHTTYVNRVYNLNTIKYIDYSRDTRALTIGFNDNTSHIIEEIEDGKNQTVFQEITRTLFKSEDTTVIKF